jgi:hypothetical protein
MVECSGLFEETDAVVITAEAREMGDFVGEEPGLGDGGDFDVGFGFVLGCGAAFLFILHLKSS